MKCVGKLLALAMLAEGITICLAQRQYLQMWRSVFPALSHWLDWFDEHTPTTRKLAIAEICFGMLLLGKLMKSR